MTVSISPASVPRPQAVAFGEALVVMVQSDPGPLEQAAQFTRALAGAEVNVAIGLAAHGIDTAVVTRVGDDGFGRYVVDELTRRGVDASAIEADPQRATGLYVKERGGDSGAPTDLGAGASRMLYYRSNSAASAISPDTLQRPEVRRVIDGSSLVHTSGITPAISESARDAMTALFRAERADRLLSFDVNWRPALWRGHEDEAPEVLAGYLRACDVALIGAPEARAVFGIDDPDALRRAFPEPRWLVVKNDGNAATAFEGRQRVDVPALTVEVVESIGAGDAFASGFLAGVLGGRTLLESVSQAHRIAAHALGSADDHVGSFGRVLGRDAAETSGSPGRSA